MEATPASTTAPDRARTVGPQFHAAVELIGRRWSGAILWSLIDGSRFFAELTAGIPGMSDRLLSARLRELEAEGLVVREVHPGTPPRVSYRLSDAGQALEPTLRGLDAWAKSRPSCEH